MKIIESLMKNPKSIDRNPINDRGQVVLSRFGTADELNKPQSNGADKRTIRQTDAENYPIGTRIE